MKKLTIIFAFFLFGCSQSEERGPEPTRTIVGKISIIPQPTSIERIGGQFDLTRETKIVATDEAGHRVSIILNEWLMANYGLTLEVTNEIGSQNSIIFSTVLSGDGLSSEAYFLGIYPGGIQIQGTERGMFYGVQSFTQLLPLDFVGSAMMIPAAEIADAPRFEYRGMHLDVARHFMPVEFLKKYIDLISRYKFNYFHWHLTDDQGWRIEIQKYPKLVEIGSKRNETVLGKNYRPYRGDGKPVEGYYTQDQIREIVSFAKARYVTIVPEIDLPGHSSAALASYPEYGCKANYSYRVKTTWGGFPDLLCPKEETFSFIDDVLGEVADLFPDSPYIHIGGDEVMPNQWKESRFVQDLKLREGLKTEADVQAWFIRRVEGYVATRNKRIIGWDEVLNDKLGPDVTVMSWQGTEPGIRAARSKRKVIMTPSEFTYFDHPQGDSRFEPLGLGGPLTLETVYDFDPVPKDMNVEDSQYIIGGQGCLWTEFIKTPDQVEYMAFPRVLALSEALWSEKRTKSFTGFYRRLSEELPRLDQVGVNYRIPKPLGLSERTLSTTEKAIVDLTPPIRDARIYFTRDGSYPTSGSTLYRLPFILDVALNETINFRTIVVHPNGRTSSVFDTKFSRPATEVQSPNNKLRTSILPH